MAYWASFLLLFYSRLLVFFAERQLRGRTKGSKLVWAAEKPQALERPVPSRHPWLHGTLTSCERGGAFTVDYTISKNNYVDKVTPLPLQKTAFISIFDWCSQCVYN